MGLCLIIIKVQQEEGRRNRQEKSYTGEVESNGEVSILVTEKKAHCKETVWSVLPVLSLL